MVAKAEETRYNIKKKIRFALFRERKLCDMDKKKKQLTAWLVAASAFFVAAAVGIGLWWSAGSRPAVGDVSDMPLVSNGESSSPDIVISQPDPVPGERLPETFRAVWFDKDDLTSLDPDGFFPSAKENGFTVAVLPAPDDRLLSFAAAAQENGLAVALSFAEMPTEEAAKELLLALPETAAVFFPQESALRFDPAVAVGVYTDAAPDGKVPDADMVAVKAGAEGIFAAWDGVLRGTDTALIAVLPLTEETVADPGTPITMQRAAEKTANYRGTAVTPARAVTADESGAVAALLLCLDGESDDVFGSELTILEPTETTYSTYGSLFTLRGSCSPVYPLRINGEILKTSADGNFTFTSDLAAGENVFTVTHRDKTVVLTVTRRIDVIRSVSPSSPLEEDGGVYLTLSAKALSGAKVTAKIAGKSITLAEEESVEMTDTEGYVTFSALYLLPDAKADKQELGKVTFKGTYDGYSESVAGGRITVKDDPSLAPTPTPTVSPTAPPEPTAPPDGVMVAKVTASHLNGVNRTKTYDAAYRDDKSAPTQYFLAENMIDTVVKEVNYTYEDKEVRCYQLSGGALIHQEDCSVSYRGKIENVIRSAALSEEGKHTVLRFNGTEPVAVFPALSPLTFEWRHPLGYAIDDFVAEKVELLFTNTIATADILGFAGNPLFSSYEWVKVDEGQYKLVLTLKKAGSFYGISTEVDPQGKIVVSFKNPVSLKAADNEYGYSLEGITVVLDAGHNGNYPLNVGAAGFEKDLHECNLNLILAEKTKAKLEALGATVVMTRTTNKSTMTDNERVRKIINADADACLAIHHNGASNTESYGTSAYYFYPFAKGLSEAVYDRMVAMYQSEIYPEGERHDECANGCRYYPYYMTRIQEYPCILVETGYVSNREEYYILIRDNIQEKVAEAFTAGIVDFLASQNG